ncbi:LysR family transcriptional regulator [Vibrio rumoiensis]|uniref:LysR family transcriptional regulator n=1 Tax=Vibrio rumoiensis 1S-45 TaxID=1188252 RepID=A0A1E5E4W4_9VIBR|nr:LysR family transcriptional regulator [Vibrio rumoiensis]OEF28169.1 LysR family transcriptional regulator [Vibrio rumoiensis 1S-45]
MLSLDIESVKAFLAIHELKSFTLAADKLGTTQGTLSVKLKRLEDKLNVKLLDRTPRKIKLSSTGEAFLPYAIKLVEANDQAVSSLVLAKKQFKLGVGCHVFGPEIEKVLSELNTIEPLLQVELSIDSSRVLLENCNSGLLNAIIIRSDDGRIDGEALCPEHFGWYATPSFTFNRHEPLPIAVLKEDCGLRNVAAQTLNKTSIKWVESFVGNNITAITSAISAGLAIGIYPKRSAPSGLIDITDKYNLPAIPPSSVLIYASYADKNTRDIMKIITDIFSKQIQGEM